MGRFCGSGPLGGSEDQKVGSHDWLPAVITAGGGDVKEREGLSRSGLPLVVCTSHNRVRFHTSGRQTSCESLSYGAPPCHPAAQHASGSVEGVFFAADALSAITTLSLATSSIPAISVQIT